jgi:PEGA domain
LITIVRFPASKLLNFILCTVFALTGTLLYGENHVLGEIVFEGATKVERTSGVWVDGQYLGYVKELKGSKKILLLPGEHDIVVRQDGYHDFMRRVALQHGEKYVLQVKMEKDPRFQMPSVTSEIKFSIDPDRAAVFVDGLFAGHAGELGGVGKSMLVAPGRRKITISLPGYQTFETEIDLAPRQKFLLKTKLLKASALQEEALRQ